MPSQLNWVSPLQILTTASKTGFLVKFLPNSVRLKIILCYLGRLNKVKPEEQLLEIKDMLYRLAYRILNNKQDAEDAVTDFYLRVHERSNTFKKYENVKGASG